MWCTCIKSVTRKVHTYNPSHRGFDPDSPLREIIVFKQGDQYEYNGTRSWFSKTTLEKSPAYIRLWKNGSYQWISVDTFKEHFVTEEEEWEDISDEMCI